MNLHLVLENVECDGDLHDTVHDSDNWECLRSCGEDTGAKLKSHYATTDADDDAWAFIMPRSLKLTVAEDLARCVEVKIPTILPAPQRLLLLRPNLTEYCALPGRFTSCELRTLCTATSSRQTCCWLE